MALNFPGNCSNGSKMRKTYKYIIAVVVFYGLIYIMLPNSNYEKCHNSETFRCEQFEGVVIAKYLDKSQHSVPVIEIKDASNSSITKPDFFGEQSGLYAVIQVN